MFLWRNAVNILRFSKLLIEKRGERGVRDFARELGISPATLSRIERGKLPDLETFGKLCSILKIDPAEMLEIEGLEGKGVPHKPPAGITAVHFKADAHYSLQAAQDLAALILAAQEFASTKA
jgi:transcriptional regulator with XRE-family HTH domain